MDKTPSTTLSADPRTFTRYLLELDARSESRDLRERSYELLGAGPGSRVVDVGCGGGTAVAELAARGVDAVGVDIEAEAIAVAREHHPGCRFEVATADELPFPDATVDGYRAEKLFHALHDPAAATAEARRVLAPGGRIVLVGQDWDTIAVDAADPHVTRAIVQATADHMPRPRAARAYGGLLLDAGFADVTVEARTLLMTGPELVLPLAATLADGARRARVVTDEQAGAWLADQEDRARRGRLLVAVPMFLGSGRRA